MASMNSKKTVAEKSVVGGATTKSSDNPAPATKPDVQVNVGASANSDVARTNAMIAGSMSSWRMQVATALALLTGFVGVRTLYSYGNNGAYLALFTVVLLLVVDSIGLASFLRAKAHLSAELIELEKPSEPTSRFWVRRKHRLQAIKDLGSLPDVDALIAVDEAELAGQASFARYLVTASVLIGLVGTFAGLSETIGSFAPLFSDTTGDFGDKLLAPLAGLAVTFGASVVAILATLALSLAAGDVALAERQVLALLEERTRHELVPALFPPSQSIAARTLAALSQLSTDWRDTSERHLSSLQDTLVEHGLRWSEDQTALVGKVATSLEQTSLRTIGLVQESTERLVAELGRMVRDTAHALTASSGQTQSTLSGVAETTAQSMQQATALLAQAVHQSTATLSSSADRNQQASSEQLVNAAARATLDLGEITQRAVAEVVAASTLARVEVGAALQRATEQVETAATRASTNVASAADLASTHVASAADRASSDVAQAANSARDGVSKASQQAATTVDERLFAIDRRLSDSHAAWLDALREQHATLADAQRALSEQQERTLVELTARYGAAATAATESHVVATRTASNEFSRLVGTLSESIGEVAREGLVRSSVELSEAARRLEHGAESFETASRTLQPSLERLSPELSAMARETSLLMTARMDEDSDEALVAELQRVSESLSEVKALLALGQPAQTMPASSAKKAKSISAEPVAAQDNDGASE